MTKRKIKGPSLQFEQCITSGDYSRILGAKFAAELSSWYVVPT